MELFKNHCIYIQDNYYSNINKIINTFNPNNTALFLFTNDTNYELNNIVGQNQIYNQLEYLDKIHYTSAYKRDMNKVIIFIDFEAKLINDLDDYNITYIYCSKNQIQHNKLILILPKNIKVSDAKRYTVLFNTNMQASDYYNYINNINYMVLYNKVENWKEYIFDGNGNYSDYQYLSFDESCDNKDYIEQEKIKIQNIINLDDPYEKKIIDLINSDILKKKIINNPTNDNHTIIYYDKFDKIKELYDLINLRK
jgi:hypothetical protein